MGRDLDIYHDVRLHDLREPMLRNVVAYGGTEQSVVWVKRHTGHHQIAYLGKWRDGFQKATAPHPHLYQAINEWNRMQMSKP